MEDIRQGVCPLCQHNEIVRGVPSDAGEDSVYNLAVAREKHTVYGITGENPHAPLGILHVYTCRACGFTQWFTRNPGEIPIGPDHRTQLITGPKPEP